jgi:alpha-glucosidase
MLNSLTKQITVTKKYFIFILQFILGVVLANAQKPMKYEIQSPNGKLKLTIETGAKITWSLDHQKTTMITPSAISMTLGNGEILGQQVKIVSSQRSTVNVLIKTPFYKKNEVADHYNQLLLECKGGYGIIFRAYDDGVAYRYFTRKKSEITVQSEEAQFNFSQNDTCFVPYVRDLRGKEQFIQSFEALYTEKPFSELYHDSLIFLPVLVKASDQKKVVITEADLENYPGMYFKPGSKSAYGFEGIQAGYPLEEFQGGYHKLNTMIARRAPFIAKVNGTHDFPWRVAVVSERDADLLNNDMVQKLAAPSRIRDILWITPGKVSWDWWNDWNLSHVDFKAGINTNTYKYYIDFASANKLEYIIMDAGWSDPLDLMVVSPDINLPEIIEYGRQKNVSVILWASWYAASQKTTEAFSKYASMGVKGFKIDFMDRDDQKMVVSLYDIAQKAADYKLVLDFHGMYKPTGLQRTYPNILNCEGVKGMENVKWTPGDDVPRYDVIIPFIRMMAGPMDYTPGAMRNSTRSGFHANGSMPMSQGTRSHQLAMYTIFEAPLQMLADNPTVYMKEQECTDFISGVPTTFDSTVALDGTVGEFVSIARRKNGVWYAGVLNNWNARDISLNLSFLGSGDYDAEIFKDGINADRDATDYKKEIKRVNALTMLNIHLSNGGGWSARFRRANN